MQEIKAELEKIGVLSQKSRNFMLDGFGMEWHHLIPAEPCRTGTKLNQDEFKKLLTAMDEVASALGQQGEYLEAKDIIEADADILIACLPSEPEMNKLIRCEAHLMRRFYRDLAEFERLQARSKVRWSSREFPGLLRNVMFIHGCFLYII